MSLHDPITLPSGLVLPNRLSKAAMAEQLAPKQVPTGKLNDVYNVWADGGWGMILTGNVQVDRRFLGGPEDVSIPTHSERPDAQNAWEAYAKAAQAHGTPAIVQINHPGRQSPVGVGTASIFTKRPAPSAIPLNFGSSFLARAVSKLLFGTPRPLTIEEIRGPDGIIAQFANAASYAHKAGFAGVELHAAHGYLLAQFVSPATNKRTDDYGGSAAKRVRIVVEIIQAIRAATSPSFTVGIKLNSVDASQSESATDIIEQVRLIVDAGIDFIEVSGGTYEDPTMSGYKHEAGPTSEHAKISSTTGVKPSTKKREAYFLEFTATLRQHFPKTVLMVTGGFRSRTGMQEAVESGACDLVGIARPATVDPRLPREIILNDGLKDEEATLVGRHKEQPKPWWMDWIPIAAVHGSWTTIYYGWQLKKIGN